MKKYQSLYRKYRPSNFKEIVGQPHLVNALQNAIANDRVSHAYLFSGPRGTGKTSTARIMAKAVNCLNINENNEPCNKCETCAEIESGAATCLVEIDAASNNSVVDIREMISTVGLSSNTNKKIYLLDEAHMLSPAASNALLKTLEEPPEHVIFILATTHPEKVLPTIKSRSQHIALSLIPDNALFQHLKSIIEKDELEVSDENIKHAVREGKGSVRDALSSLDRIISIGGEQEGSASVEQLVEGINNGDTSSCMEVINQAIASGQDPRIIAEKSSSYLRDTLLHMNNGLLESQSYLITEPMKQISRQMSQDLIIRSMRILGGSISRMSPSNDTRIILETAILEILSNNEAPMDNAPKRIEPKAAIHSVKQAKENVIPQVANNQEENTEDERSSTPPDTENTMIEEKEEQESAEIDTMSFLGFDLPNDAAAELPASQGNEEREEEVGESQKKEVPEKTNTQQQVLEEERSLTLDELSNNWNKIIDEIGSPPIKMLYGDSELVSIDDTNIVIKLQDAIPIEKASSKLDILNNALTDKLGVDVEVSLT